MPRIAKGPHHHMIVVGAYLGGTRFGGSLSPTNPAANGFYNNHTGQSGNFAYNHSRTGLTEQGIGNLVWSAHNYYTGVKETSRLSGTFNAHDGQENNGARPYPFQAYEDNRPHVWAEGANSGGCYTERDVRDSDRSFDWTGACTGSLPNQTDSQDGHRWNAEGSWLYAQAASMPFFMGEWGVGRQRYLTINNNASVPYQGWVGGNEMLCDKLEAYRDVDGNGARISWAAWSFNADSDGFGLYFPLGATRNGPAFDNLTKGAYVDSGTFQNSGNWSGDAWTYAQPFIDAGQPGSCRG